jgi:hypothetical protein
MQQKETAKAGYPAIFRHGIQGWQMQVPKFGNSAPTISCHFKSMRHITMFLPAEKMDV